MEMTIIDVARIAQEELQQAFADIQQPRSDYQLEHFVVREKDTEAAQYAQCVLEMQIKYNSIRRSLIRGRRLEVEIRKLRDTGDELQELDAEEKEIDLEDLALAKDGALREFSCLYRIFKSFGQHYNYDDIQRDQTEYWGKRLVRQARADINSTGRIGQGNAEALRQAGIDGWDDTGNPKMIGRSCTAYPPINRSPSIKIP